MTHILNLTEYPATPEQVAAGVVDLDADSREAVRTLLTFDVRPTLLEIHFRAEALAQYATNAGCRSAMINGAPFFMSALERALWRRKIRPLYAFFSRYKSVETMALDGVVRRIVVFRHAGFVGIEAEEEGSTRTLYEMEV